MASHPRTPGPRGDRRGRRLRPCLLPLEPRVVPSLTFPGIAGITFDTSGDVFVSYNSTTRSSGQQQSVAEVGVRRLPGQCQRLQHDRRVRGPRRPDHGRVVGLAPVHHSSGDILELQPDGQLFVFNPVSGTSSQYDNLAELHRECVECLRRPDGRLGQSQQPDQSGGRDVRRFRRLREFAGDLRRVEQLGLRDAGDLRRHRAGSPRSWPPRRPATGSRPRPGGSPSTRRGRSSPRCPTCPRVPPRRSTCRSDSASSTTREAAPRRPSRRSA